MTPNHHCIIKETTDPPTIQHWSLIKINNLRMIWIDQSIEVSTKQSLYITIVLDFDIVLQSFILIMCI